MAGPTGMMNGHAQVPLTVTGQVTGPGMLAPPQMQVSIVVLHIFLMSVWNIFIGC